MIENIEQVHSIVAQVILGVAIAEEALQFEHRDLQMDNVLVKMTSCETAVFIYNKKKIVVHTRGVIACIIDFNLSRATIETNVQGTLQFLYEMEIFLRNQDYDDGTLKTIRSLKTELNQYRALSTFASRSTVLPKLLLLEMKN
ncbi:hypothetical protein V5799_015184 [Amblyomma americanum]|uniref:Protein kinase domain-containing protein n=1 Tax=Amblyomma americanum TaxID=6943 RepID=A0AAQ4E0V3_AMBAM